MPSTDTLTALVQRLIRAIGAESAIELARSVPGLQVDQDGRVLAYHHQEAMDAARMLIELYDAVTGSSPNHTASHAAG